MSAAGEDQVRETARWLRYAQEDLDAAEALGRDSSIAPREGCWLAQQAAEKALKAALCFLGIGFSKTHDLDALRNLLPEDWETTRKHTNLGDLTIWTVQARYPGDWPDATDEDARKALEIACGVLETVLEDLKSNGSEWSQEG